VLALSLAVLVMVGVLMAWLPRDVPSPWILQFAVPPVVVCTICSSPWGYQWGHPSSLQLP